MEYMGSFPKPDSIYLRGTIRGPGLLLEVTGAGLVVEGLGWENTV